MKTFVVLAALVFTASLSAEVHKQDVDIQAPDGVNLKGTYFSAGQQGPAILLLHQCNMDRHAWDGLAAALAANGFNVLTFDFRGYGESGGEKGKKLMEQAEQMRKWPADVDTAFAFLTSQKDVDQGRIAVGGASCGVMQSADLAVRHHEIRALVLLSGVVSDAAKQYIGDTTLLPVFGAASEDDSGAAQGIKDVMDASQNNDSLLKIYPGSAHGVPMFDSNAELQPMIVDWLKARLTAAAASQ